MITAAPGTLTASNYVFSNLVNGTLTITAAPPAIVVAPVTPPSLPTAVSGSLSSAAPSPVAAPATDPPAAPASGGTSAANTAPATAAAAPDAQSAAPAASAVPAAPVTSLPAASLSVTGDASGAITVTGKAAPGEIISVTFADGSKGAAVAAADGSYAVTSSAPQANKQVTAVATATGATAAAAPAAAVATAAAAPVAKPAPASAAPAKPAATPIQRAQSAPAQVPAPAPVILASPSAAPVAAPVATPASALAATTVSPPAAATSAPTPDASAGAAPAAPATIRSVQQSIAGGANAASSVTALVDAHVSSAVASGLPADRAGPAGKAFSRVLMNQLSKGVPPDKAVAMAQKVFKAEASFPKPKSPQEAAVKNISSSGQNIGIKLTSLANAKTSSGSAAFDKSLAVALAKGGNFASAVKAAQQAVKTAEMLAKADNTPHSALANANGAGVRNASGPLAKSSPAFQKSLSSMLVKGIPLAEAMQRANQADLGIAAAAQADANNPSVGLSRGNFSEMKDKPADGPYGKMLSAALAKGISAQEAMARAAEIEAFEEKTVQADLRSPLAGLSNGGAAALPKAAPDFDRALASAIARGESPADAIASAQRTLASMPQEVHSATSALASGRNIDTQINSPGNSHMFRTALSAALARGVAIDKALAEARSAEERNAFRFALPSQVGRAPKTRINITLQNGDPLPPWLHYVPETRSFIAFNVPEGAFPIKVIVNSAGQQSAVVISEGPAQK